MHITAQRNKAGYTLFFTTITSLLPKKSLQVNDEPASTVDFHLQIVNKIDELLKETKPAPPPQPVVPDQIIFHSPPSVEERAPIARHPGHDDVTFDIQTLQLHRPNPIPEEFKADFPFGVSPSFRFVTSLDPLDDLAAFKRRDSRVEIIDLATLRNKDLTTTTQFSTKQAPAPQHTHADIAFLSAMADADEQGTESSQLYYLQSKSFKDKKAEKEDRDLSYIPIDLSERIQHIKEQEQEEEEKQQRREEKEHKKQKKIETPEEDTADNKPPNTKKKTKDAAKAEPTATKESEADLLTKKQQKLAARQAKLEQKKQKQQARLLLKEQRKKDLAKKQNAKTKKTKPAKEHKEKRSLFKKKTPLPEVDDDLIKFLQLTDTLLGQLPEDVIDQFAHSDDFELYEKVMARYHAK